MMQKGELGEIFSVHGSYLQDWLFYATDYNWRLEPHAPASRARWPTSARTGWT